MAEQSTLAYFVENQQSWRPNVSAEQVSSPNYYCDRLHFLVYSICKSVNERSYKLLMRPCDVHTTMRDVARLTDEMEF